MCVSMSEPSTSSYEVLCQWLALERIPGVGPLSAAKLMDAFGSPSAILRADSETIRAKTGLSERLCRSIAEFEIPEDKIAADIETLKRLNARLLTRWEEDYPESIRDIYDPPAFLFCRGEIRASDNRAVAMVGTRNPSRYGLDMAESISRDLAAAGFTIVSGLARGIDTACHRAALEAGGRTIGVLGCGIDVSYPRENKILVEEMTRSGAVITELRPGIAPLPTGFFRRNRIVSGLTRGVVVVECAMKSGSLITANHALDQNRDVFAVPGNVMNMRSRGPHHLIRQGAALVESAQDVIAALAPASDAPVQARLFSPEPPPALSETAARVLEVIDPDPTAIDDLCQAVQLDAGKLAAILLELEMEGLIRQHPGKMFSRVHG